MTRELEAERDTLLQSLRDLEEERAAGDLDDETYAELKDTYTARAAAVLRQLETPLPAPDAPSDASRRTPIGRPPRWRLAAGALALAALSGGIGYAVAQSSGERGVGDEATGDLPEGSVDRITKAQALVAGGEILEAVKVYDDLLEDDPENPVALAQRGWLLSRVDPSLVDSGLASIDRAIAVEPGYPDAHFFRGMILWKAKDDPALAIEAFQRAIDAKPPAGIAATIEGAKQQAQADLDARTATTTTP